VKLYTGTANPELANSIATILGIPLGKAKVGKFSNGETMVEIEVRLFPHADQTCKTTINTGTRAVLLTDFVRLLTKSIHRLLLLL